MPQTNNPLITSAAYILSLILAACVSPVSKEEFLADQENTRKIEELSKAAIPDTEECKEIQNFIAKEEDLKNAIFFSLKIYMVH